VQVEAIDTDEGINSMLLYSISDANGQPTNDVTINATSGHVTADVTFDRESRDLYQFLVTVTDLGHPHPRSNITFSPFLIAVHAPAVISSVAVAR